MGTVSAVVFGGHDLELLCYYRNVMPTRKLDLQKMLKNMREIINGLKKVYANLRYLDINVLFYHFKK
jgi:hypothetical protein